MTQFLPAARLGTLGKTKTPVTSIEACLFKHPFYKRGQSKGIKQRALHVHRRKTKHFIAKLFAQPYKLLQTFSILVTPVLKVIGAPWNGVGAVGPAVGAVSEAGVIPWTTKPSLSAGIDADALLLFDLMWLFFKALLLAWSDALKLPLRTEMAPLSLIP